MNVEIEVERWSEASQEWTPYKTMVLPVFTSMASRDEFFVDPETIAGAERLMTGLPSESRDVVMLACQAFARSVRGTNAAAGYCRLGLDVVLQWTDGQVRWAAGAGPRDLECRRCEMSVETTRQGDEIPCPECGEALSIETG